jgi:hypothetical protein
MRGLAIGAAGVLAFGAAALAVDAAPHPAHIHGGLCASRDDVAQALSDVSNSFLVGGPSAAGTLPAGATSAIPVEEGITTVPLALSVMLASPHVIVVQGTADDPTTVIACGDIGGLPRDPDTLLIGLGPVGGSGYAGVATLHDVRDGTTTVDVALTQVTAAGAPSPSAAPSPSGVPAASTVTLDQDLYFAGWNITIGDATYDPAAATIAISGSFENLGDLQRSLLEIQQVGGVRLVWGDQIVEVAFEKAGLVPAHSAVLATLVGVYAMPEGFSLDQAVLTFGQPTDQQATLALAAGSVGQSVQPAPFDVSGRVRLKGVSTTKITGGQVIAASCGGRPDEISYSIAASDEVSILLSVVVSGGKSTTSLDSFITGPGGISAPGTPGALGIVGAHSTTDGLFCYTVKSPATGSYTLTVQGAGKTGKLKFTVP